MSYFTHAITQLSRSSDDITVPEPARVSLEDRLVQAYAKEAVDASEEQREVMALLQDSRVIANPEALFNIQRRTADYNLHVSLISTLTRKGVGAVETLLRS